MFESYGVNWTSLYTSWIPTHWSTASSPAASGLTALPTSAADRAAASYVMGQMKSGKLTVFDANLTKLYLEGAPHAALGAAAAGMNFGAYTSSITDMTGSMSIVGGQTYVTVDIVARGGDGAKLLAALQAAHVMDNAVAFKGMVSGQIAVSHLDGLRDVLAGATDGKADDIGYAMASGHTTNIGLVTTQADAAQHADDARSNFSVNGAGIKVGVLSDSFDTLASASDHMADNIASKDLPKATSILHDFTGGHDEGRGMAQLVHDLAPNSPIMFDTAEGGQAAFAQHILDLQAAGAGVIVDDVIYFAEPMFQDGVIAQAIDSVSADGAVYFSSAGNNGDAAKPTGYEGNWVTGGKYTSSMSGDKVKLMHFAGGQDYIPITLAGAETVILQWDQPAASAGGPGATSDLDIFLTNQDGSVVYVESTGSEVGFDPVTGLGLSGGSGGTYYIRVGLHSGAAPGKIRLVTLGNGGDTFFTSPSSNTNPGAFYGHAAADGAIGVGAAYWSQTPEFGVTPPAHEYFTSGGYNDILFDTAGNRLATPDMRYVDITAADGGDTTFFGFDDGDAGSFPNFYGTSAAAPDAAAVAALMLNMRSGLTPDDIKGLLMDSATDMDDSAQAGFQTGFDSRTGAGFIDANLAVGFASTLVISSASQTTLYGTHFGDTINGASGGDILWGKAGTDSLNGDGGDDVLDGGDGNDTLNGAGGNDTAAYWDAGASVKVKIAGGSQNTGGAGSDTLVGIENLTGSDYNDKLTGNGGDNVLTGGLGRDTLSAKGGNDTFMYLSALDSPVGGSDLLKDFAAGDKIDVSAIDADTTTNGDQAFHVGGGGGHAGDIVASYDSGTHLTTVNFYTDNDATVDFAILMSGDHSGLASGDFTL